MFTNQSPIQITNQATLPEALSPLAVALKVWRERLRAFGRFLWFFFFFMITMAPFNMAVSLINPRDKALFSEGHFSLPVVA
jgi:hypothetical protein